MKKKKRLKKGLLTITIVISLLILTVITFFTIISINKKKCNNLYNEIDKNIESLIKNNQELFIGNQITINIKDLNLKDKYKKINGNIIITNYNGNIIYTYDLENASYCKTSDYKNSSEYVKSTHPKVEITYNYKTLKHQTTDYSEYIIEDNISKKKTLNVNLPIDKTKLPSVPENAIITSYIKEDKTLYSYRDTQYKYYKNKITYSNYSSEKPDGFENKDEQSKITTEFSEYTENKPEEKEYRTIEAKEENGKTLYRYKDEKYRWYNGTNKRYYTVYLSKAVSSYPYKDEETKRTTLWTKYEEESTLNDSNSSYREERSKNFSRYKIEYDIPSNPLLNKYVAKDQLEKELGKSLLEISNDKDIKLEINYKFYY